MRSRTQLNFLFFFSLPVAAISIRKVEDIHKTNKFNQIVSVDTLPCSSSLLTVACRTGTARILGFEALILSLLHTTDSNPVESPGVIVKFVFFFFLFFFVLLAVQ